MEELEKLKRDWLIWDQDYHSKTPINYIIYGNSFMNFLLDTRILLVVHMKNQNWIIWVYHQLEQKLESNFRSYMKIIWTLISNVWRKEKMKTLFKSSRNIKHKLFQGSCLLMHSMLCWILNLKNSQVLLFNALMKLMQY